MTHRLRTRSAATIGLLVVIGATASGLLGVQPTRADELEDARARHREVTRRIEQQQAQLEALDAAEAQLTNSLERTATSLQEINTDLTAVRRDVEATRAALAAAQARHAALVAEVRHLDWTLALLEGEVAEHEAELQERRRLLGKRLAESYRVQQTSLLQQLLTADSLTEALSSSASYLQLGSQDAELARGIERDQANLDSLRRNKDALRYRTDRIRAAAARRAADLDRKREQLEAAEAKLVALEAQTKRLQQEQLAQFDRLVQTRAQAEAALKAQQTSQAKLRHDIQQITYQHVHAGAIPSQYAGTFQWPLAGRVSQEFGCTGFGWEPAFGDCPHFHRGIDIVAPAGAPIVAAADGVVLFVGFNPYDDPRDPAWIVIIAHSETLQTWYAHGEPRLPEGIAQGAPVKAGQVVGYEGNTGRSTGAHLHWAVQLNGEFVNPRLFL